MFDTIETWITVDVDEIAAESDRGDEHVGRLDRRPGRPLNSMNAFAFVLTLFEATIAPPERPVGLRLRADRDVDRGIGDVLVADRPR